MNPLTLLRMAPWLAILGLIAALTVVTHQRDNWHKQFTAEHAGRLQDRATYEQAQKDAAALNDRQIAQRLQQQKATNDAQVSTLARRLELIRSELRKAPATAEGAANGAQASPGVESPCRVTDPAWMCLSPEERLRAAENEERHDELIDLVINQSK